MSEPTYKDYYASKSVIPPADRLFDPRTKGQDTVIEEMITGLESKLPPDARINLQKKLLSPADIQKDLETKLQELLEENKNMKGSIESRIKDLEIQTAQKINDPKSSSMSPSEATIKLKEIVDSFNAQLGDWYKNTECVVNFGWNYSQFKKLEVLGIDYIVYRKPAPNEATMREIMDGDSVPMPRAAT